MGKIRSLRDVLQDSISNRTPEEQERVVKLMEFMDVPELKPKGSFGVKSNSNSETDMSRKGRKGLSKTTPGQGGINLVQEGRPASVAPGTKEIFFADKGTSTNVEAKEQKPMGRVIENKPEDKPKFAPGPANPTSGASSTTTDKSKEKKEIKVPPPGPNLNKKDAKLSVSLPRSLRVMLEPKAFVQLFGYGNQTELEISLLGLVEKEGSVFTIKEFFLLEQTGSGASTEIDEDKTAAFLQKLHEDGRDADLGKIRCWAHTHPQMETFWSEEDEKMCHTLSNDWTVAIVYNEQFELKCRVDIGGGVGVPVTIDNVPTYLKYALPDKLEELAKEVKEKVTKKIAYSPVTTYRSGDYPHQGGWNPRTGKFEDGNPQDNYYDNPAYQHGGRGGYNKDDEPTQASPDEYTRSVGEVEVFGSTNWPGGWDQIACRIMALLSKTDLTLESLTEKLGGRCLICDGDHSPDQCQCWDCIVEKASDCWKCVFQMESKFAQGKLPALYRYDGKDPVVSKEAGDKFVDTGGVVAEDKGQMSLDLAPEQKAEGGTAALVQKCGFCGGFHALGVDNCPNKEDAAQKTVDKKEGTDIEPMPTVTDEDLQGTIGP